MSKIRLREISDRACDVDRERAEIQDRRRQASRIAENAQKRMGEIRRDLDSLPSDAPYSERSRLLSQYHDCEAEYSSATRAGEECDIRSERLNEEAREIIALAEDYLESANNQMRQACEAQSSSSYGRDAIAALATSIRNNGDRARQIISLLGGSPSFLATPGGSVAEDPTRFFSDYQALIQTAAFGTLEGVEGVPSLADRQTMVSFVNASYTQGVVALAQNTPGIDQSNGVKVLMALDEAYRQTNAGHLWDDPADANKPEAKQGDSGSEADTVVVFEEQPSSDLPDGGNPLAGLRDRDSFVSTMYALAEGENEKTVQRGFTKNGDGTVSVTAPADITARYNQVCECANERIAYLASALDSANATGQQLEDIRSEILFTRQILSETTSWLLQESGDGSLGYAKPALAPIDFRIPLPDSAFKEALPSNNPKEFFRRVTPLPATKQSWEVLGNGNRVYNTPVETGASLNWHQGIAYSNIQGDCGLVCCENVARLAGKKVTEADVVGFARDNYLCTVGTGDPGSNGGTFAHDRQALLSHMGIDSYLDANTSVEHVANLVETGHGVVASVDVGKFWKEYAYDNAGGHAVTLLSVEKDSGGSPVAFYVCDSGIRDRSRRVDVDTFLLSLIDNVPMNVTKGIIR